MDGLTINSLLSSPWALAVWAAIVTACVGVLLRDLRRNNAEIVGLMRWVWLLTVVYSGPIGLAGYYWSGRKQIPRDGVWRRAFRSVAHCYSGCGGGEAAGVFIAVGLLSLSNVWVAAITFTLAYVAGFGLTIGPLMQEGVSFREAVHDAFVAETASITVMEVTAIGLDIWLAGGAGMGDVRFWWALIVSLTAGLFAAYPVNAVLIHWGVKEGMHDPREMAAHA